MSLNEVYNFIQYMEGEYLKYGNSNSEIHWLFQNLANDFALARSAIKVFTVDRSRRQKSQISSL